MLSRGQSCVNVKVVEGRPPLEGDATGDVCVELQELFKLHSLPFEKVNPNCDRRGSCCVGRTLAAP